MIKFRKWLAWKLARLARRIYPKSPEYYAFITDTVVDAVIYGGAVTRIAYKDFAKGEPFFEQTQNKKDS